jgi:hypothetical protein
MKKIFVDCFRAGEFVVSYDFGIPQPIMPGLPPDVDQLIDEAKTNLSNDRLAFPPYEGITFKIR